MRNQRKQHEKLEAEGWKVGTVQDFLAFSDEETLVVEIKLALGRDLR